MYVGYDPNRIRNRNSGSYEPELTFVDTVLVQPEPESHVEIPVPVIRTETMGPEF